MSTFTIVHHTVPEIKFKPADQWKAGEAQLTGTVHCDYPRWVEVLCHDINVHIPHHISVAIPSYNLRKAHASLKENYRPLFTATDIFLGINERNQRSLSSLSSRTGLSNL